MKMLTMPSCTPDDDKSGAQMDVEEGKPGRGMEMSL